MSKRIALKDYVEIDGDDLSTYFRQIGVANEDERVDASGFNSSGNSEFLQGVRTQTIEAEIFVARGSGESQDQLYPLYRDRTTFVFRWRADGSAGVSSTNPEWVGNGKLFGWSEGATRGEVETTTVTIEAADATGFVLTYS